MSMMIHRAVLRMRAKEVKPMPSPAVNEPPKEEKVKETAKQQTRKRKAE